MIRNDDLYTVPFEKEKKREIEHLGSKKEIPNTLNCPISQSNY